MSRRVLLGPLLGLAASCAPPRAVELPQSCTQDVDCGEYQTCEEGYCVDFEPPPWDGMEGVEVFPAIDRNPNWDILIVLDDSPTMAQWQETLAANFGPLVQKLDEPGVDGSYRIGITTTSVSGPGCESGATDGALVRRSCLDRPEDFVADGVDVFAQACADTCAYSAAELDARMLPTTTDDDPVPRVRPWLERLDDGSNLPDDISTGDAASCLFPQGISGCEREAPLEAMFRALARFADPDDPAFGFLREGASFFVLMITNEADCSIAPAGADLLDPDNPVFWDPLADQPTDAACWNAGVECEPDASDRLWCTSADRAPDGSPAGPDDAVLYPVSRYVDVLEALRQTKAPDTKVLASVITGVPSGYSHGQDDIDYVEASDPAFQAQYGIGPGCARSPENEWALPPVRLREWGEVFGDRNLHSICDFDYTPALQEVADRIASQLRPTCYHYCAADHDPAAGLQPRCRVWQTVKDAYPEELVPCVYQDAWIVPDGANVCFFLRTDPEQTGDPFDDLSDECIEDGSNTELKILRREGFPAPWPTDITMACELAEDPETVCPELVEHAP